MKDVEKLIGGYATGTLTEQEQQALFAAALENQALFDALADEEALRALLADPAARRQLLAQLEPTQEHTRPGLHQRATGWFFRPWSMALVAGAGAAILAIVLVPSLVREDALRQVAMSRPAERTAPYVASTPVPEADQAAPKPEPSRSTPPAPVRAAEPRPVKSAPAANVELPQTLARGEPSPPVKQEEREAAAGPAQARSDRPAAPVPAAPPPPAPAGVRAEAPAEARLAKMAVRADPPFEHRMERQNSAGEWTEIGNPAAGLPGREPVRLVLQTREAGTIAVTLRAPDGTARLLYQGVASSGARIQVPSTGGLPADSGEHRLQIVFSGAQPAVSNLRAQGFRMSSQDKKRQAGEAVLDEAVGPSPSYTVEIPLRFR